MPIKPVSGEIDSQEINDNLSYLESLALQANGGPIDDLTSETALNSKHPNGANGLVLVNGYLYLWNGAEWRRGSPYTPGVISSKGVTYTKLADNVVDANKAIFLEVGKNKFNPDAAVVGYLNESGEIAQVSGNPYETTNYIPFSGNNIVNSETRFVCLYDTNYNPVGSRLTDMSGIVLNKPSGVMYYRSTHLITNRENVQIEFGNTMTSYERYSQKITHQKPASSSEISDRAITEEKTSFIKASLNLFDRKKVTKGSYLNPNNGNLVDNEAYQVSDFIDISNLYEMGVRNIYINIGHTACLYNLNQQMYEGYTHNPQTDGIVIPITDRARYLRIGHQKVFGDVVMVSTALVEKPEPAVSKMNTIGIPETNLLSDDLEFAMTLPSKLYSTIGKEFTIYSKNIVPEPLENYRFRYEINNGKDNNDTFDYLSAVAGIYQLIVSLNKKRITKQIKGINLVNSTERTSPIKVLYVGDSYIEEGYILERVKNELDINVELIGRKTTRTVNHEGNGGWQFTSYVNINNSPFVNPNTETFDFGYYLSENNLDTPDVVIFNLGINDVVNLTNDDDVRDKVSTVINVFDGMIDNIKQFNQTIKIAWSTPAPPNSDKAIFGELYGTTRSQWRVKYNNHLFTKLMLDYFDGKIDIISQHAVVDDNNYKDAIHCNLDGYNQLGDYHVSYLNSL